MKRILVVDDDAELLEALQRRFYPHRREWQIAVSSNGVEALRLAREQPFDLLITDILMPEKDGIEVIGALRREYPGMKIVAMSGGGRHLSVEPLSWARDLGANATLEKPFDFRVLRDTVRALLDLESDDAPCPEGGPP